MTPDDARHILYRLDRQDEQLERIEQHASETNGRVKALELWRARLDGVRAAVAWLPSLLSSVVGGVIVGVLVYLLT